MGTGEVVGEMSLLTGEPRAATVRSVEESVVYEIAQQHYETLLVEHPEWLDDLAIIMEERLARRHVRMGQLEARAGSVRELIRRNFLR
jgi:CRP-like cAMP-binding protein